MKTHLPALRAALALALSACTASAFAQPPAETLGSYPSRPIRLIVPFSAGGFTDVVARLLSVKLGEALGQPVVIDNKPGAGSTLGTALAAQSPADGYTLLMISTAQTIVPAMYKNLSYDTLKSFTPVVKLVEAPYVLVANPELPVKSIRELVAYAKARPGVVNYASSGNGSIQHLSGALFASMSGISMSHVPYRGSGQATTDLVGGVVQLGFVAAPLAIQQAGAGRLRALAVTSAKRSPQMPDVPTLDEAGVKGYDATSWAAILAPAGTPAAIIARLNAEMVKALAAPDAAKALGEAGIVVTTSTPAALHQLMVAELDKWGKVVRDTGATIN